MANVCMVGYTFYASDPRVRREAEALADRGDEVHFICLKDDKNPAREINDVRLYPLGVGRYQGESALWYVWQYTMFFIKAAFLISFLFVRYRYKVVQVHTMPDFLVFTALVPKLFGARVILDVHDLVPELYMCKFGKAPDDFVIRAMTWIEKRSIGFADRALAVHIPHREALVAHGNPASKFTVLMNVPDPKIFETKREPPIREDQKFRLVYHGTVAKRHGLEVALNAIQRLKPRIPHLDFLVIGYGDDLVRIKGLVAAMQLQDVVRFDGRMAVERLPDRLRQADVGLIPLLYDEFTQYMLPLKLMEYARLGIPSIVSRTKTIQAYFEEKMVWYVKPGDVTELAEAIWQLYTNPERRRQLAANAEKFNIAYDWNTQRQSYYDLMDSLLEESAA